MAEGEHLFTVVEVHQEPEAVAETHAKKDHRAKEQEVEVVGSKDPKENPTKQQDRAASVLQSPTEGSKRTQKKKTNKDNRKRQKELQGAEEQPVSYHGDDVVKFLDDDSDDSDGDGQTTPDATLKGVASGPSIHGRIGMAGGQRPHFPPGSPGSPEIMEQAGTGDNEGTQDPSGSLPRQSLVSRLTEPGTASLGEWILERLPKKFKRKTPHSDDVAITINEEQPGVQDNKMNFISQFGTTEQQATVRVKKERGTEFTMIRSINGSSSHGGVRMIQEMNEEWNYFEVAITRTVGAGEIGIGVGHKDYPLYRMPGWDDGSIGYHADDGGLFREDGFPRLYGPPCTIGDRMGCGVDFTPKAEGHVCVWFTKNGEAVINAQIMELPDDSESKLYPLVCMKWSGQEVRYLGHWQKPPPTEKDESDDVAIFISEGHPAVQDDIEISKSKEQPVMQGNKMNLITKFGTTEQQATVKKERGTDYTMIRSINGSSNHGGVRLEQAMNPEWNYFEVTITRKVGDGEIGIGVGHKNYPLFRMPGWDDGSIGYHADDGGLFHEDGYPLLHAPLCTIGDTMGCGVDFTQSSEGHVRVWFTKNNNIVINPQTVQLPVDLKSKLYPLIGMKWSGQEVRYLGHCKTPPPTEDVESDDVTTSSNSSMQAIDTIDRVNLISQFGSTQKQMAVTVIKKEKGTEFTMIRSQYGSSNHSGVRMDQAMNQEWNYFEVEILHTVGAGEIGIGVGHRDYPLSEMPGWNDGSIGYHADDGGFFHENGFPLQHGPPCAKGDRMGCGVDFTPSRDGHVCVWFTKNDQVVMKPQAVTLPVNSNSKLYPLICMMWSGQEVRYLGHWKKPVPFPNDDEGDRVNFISEFGTTEQQVTVKKQRGTNFTIIRSHYGSNRHGGVRMKQAMNQERNYFEVTITDTIGDGEVGIGVGHKNYPISRMPGYDDGSIGYHADNGGLYHEYGSSLMFGPTCKIGDRMGCGVDFTPKEDGLVRVWFTKNDKMVINPQIVKPPADSDSKLYPLICMEESGQEVQYLGHWQKIPPTEDGGMQIQTPSPTVVSAGDVHPVHSSTGLASVRGGYARLLKKSSHRGGSINLIKRFGTTKQYVTVTTEGEVTKLRSCNENNGIASVRMKWEMNQNWNYFEVTITDTVGAGEVGIGLGHKTYSLSDMPGWRKRSIGYHADDGGLYHEHGSAQVHGSTCAKGDRMGCGVDFTPSRDGHVRVWFTKNDQVVFEPQTVELPVSSESKFYPLISMRGSGQEVQYKGHWQKSLPKKVVPIPWWRAAGFGNEKNVPFYTKEATVEKYGEWEATPDYEVEFIDFVQFHHSCLKQFRDTKKASECKEKAEAFIRNYPMYELEADFVGLKAPNGKELEPCDRVILFLARMLIGAVGKEEAIPFFMSIGGLNNAIMDMAMVGAMLYMGCTTDHFLKRSKYLSVFLNWKVNPNIRDHDGRTALHIHQTYLGSVKMLVACEAEVNLQDNSGNTPLHVAARKGRTAVAELLLQHHASTSLVNNENETALDTAAVHGNLECFKTVFTRATMSEREKYRSDLRKWKKACQKLASKEGHVQHEKIEGLSQVQIYCATVSKTNQGCESSVQDANATDRDQVISVQRLVSEAAKYDVDLTPQLLTKIFDACIFGHKLVITDILEADLDGNLPNTVIPTDKESTDGRQSETEIQKETSLLPYLSNRPKLFFKLAKHPTLKTFVKVQWKKQASHVFWFRFLYYLFKMVVLTFALAIAARPELTDDKLNKYPQPLDYFRGICEVVVVLTTLLKIGEEAAEIAVSRRSYFKDWTNYLEWLYVFFILFIIPFRVLSHPGQWIVASLTYCLNGLKIIEFVAIWKWSGAYLQTLRIIITRDIVRFMTVFVILLVIFSGGLYLSLRYDGILVFDPDTNTTSYGDGTNSAIHSLDGEGRLLHELYFTGLRALIEAGNVLDYYGPNSSFRPMSVIIYLLFLFIVVIVLLNVLIAQVSDTYGKVLSTAEGVYLYHKCRYIARLEEQHFAPCMLCYIVERCCCWYRGTRSQGCMCLKFSSKQRQWPNVIWIGKKRSQGIVQWKALMKKVADFFEVYSFDEDDDLSLTEVEEDTQKLERKLEQEHKWFEDKMNKIEEVLADKPSSFAVSQFVEGETQKLKQKIEEEVGGLAERLTNKLPEHYHEGSCPVRVDGREDSRHQETTAAIALHISSMQNLEEEVRKLANQLQEVKSLLLKEQPNYPSTQDWSHPVPGGQDGEQRTS